MNFKDQTNEATLFKSDSFTLLAEKIYKITGILAQGEDSLIKACGYNAPAALISVAKQLGLKVEFVITEDQEKEFIAKFPNQLEWCKSVLYPNEIKIVNNDADTSPNEREVALTLMKTFVDSFHWIAQSSNNTYFDSLRNFYPGNQYGRVGNTWSSRPYTDTGMIIKLSK